MRYAVITGASAGIGKAITEKLLSEGFYVAVCARSRDKLELQITEWRDRYTAAQIIGLAIDVSVKEEIGQFSAMVLQSFPRIDIVVNNAGLYLAGNMADEPEEQLEALINTNLYAAYRLTRSLLPTMKQQGSGHIFNICSIASLKGYAGIGSYSISKYALLGFSDNLREELRPYNIKVTAICPGATWTSSWEGSNVPTDRIMDANDIAGVLLCAANLSQQCGMETIVMRPVKGDL